MKRLEIEREGETAVLDYTTDENTLSIWHVQTPPALRGRGVGGELVEKARAMAEQQSLRLNPVCSFAKYFLAKSQGK